MKHELRAAIRSVLATRSLMILGGTMALAATVEAAELPVVCAAGNCGAGGPSSWVTSGTASATQTQSTLTIDQTSERAVLNWASFNVSADGRVVFNQPNANSIALNRIYQDSPSRIFGAVEANGQIYLVNPNGFVFGRTAKIDAAGILASTLSISDQTFASGLLAPELINTSRPALGDSNPSRTHVLDRNDEPVVDENGEPIEVKLVVEEGATLQSRGSGGRVLLASRAIDNAGTIASPDGQVIVAAGDRVYLQASTDPGLRGLLVEVDAGGEAWNRMTGNISAARGNVTVAGLAVNQSGRISASTTVAANGSVRLLARDNPRFIPDNDNTDLGAGQNGGRLDIGATSRIEVLPEINDAATAVDDQPQLASRIDMSGREVLLRSGSQIVAPAGQLSVTAASNPASTVSYDPSARIRVESGAQIDLSGSDVTLPMSRNLVTVELRANELRDSPAQRNGALRGQTVVVDARIGTPLADVSGALAAVPKNIAERTSRGGTAVFNSEGDVSVAEGARIDVSGGVTTFLEGPVSTSQLIGADGKLYDIGDADPMRTYVGVLNPMFRRADERWGYVDLIAAPGINRIEPGYLAGSDAGTVQFAAPSMIMSGSLRAQTIIGPYQRRPGRQPLGGQLIIGLPEGLDNSVAEDYRAPSVTFSRTFPVVSVGDDSALPPQQTLLLPTDYLNRGFTRTAIYSNGVITVPEDTPLNLAANSALRMTGQRVDILADIGSTSGTIAATSALTIGTAGLAERAGVSVGEGVTLDVQGNWTNDALSAVTDPFGRPSTSVLADGGSIALAVDADDSELVIGDQVRLLANAGAWLQRDGSLQGGDGGSISIAAGAINGALAIGEDTAVEAFGVLGARGGSFSLTAPRIQVADGNLWTAGQRIDSLDEDFGYFNIGSSLFSAHGFRSVSLTAAGAGGVESDREALRILDGTQLQARTSVWQLDTNSYDAANARNLAGLASIALAEESARGPMALAFAVSAGGVTRSEDIGLLRMGQGASIVTDAGSTVRFSSAGGIELDGSVRAHGGNIGLTVTAPPDAIDIGYRADIGVRVGSNAVLDASGTSVYEPVGNGLLHGTLFDGGSVSLQANRGSVVVEQGALIDVSGSSAAFDRTLTGTDGVKREVIASNAGVLSVVAPEAIAFSGELRAHAGTGETGTAHGGELVMRLSRLRGFEGRDDLETYPTHPRVMRVTSENIGVGGSPPSGFAIVREDLLESSGIDALTLEADGRIELDSTTLAMGRRVVLDSPELFARDGASIRIDAPYIGLGSSRTGRAAAAAPSGGTGSFSFNGSFIEAIGAVSLSGAATTTIASTGDVRLREIQEGTAREGHLRASGDVTLRATQIYPATLSSYALSVLGENGTLRIESAGTPGATPLTAGGQLILTAANIEQNGTLLAPFGIIAIDATETLSLGAGSLTSVSGNGALIPFGRIENGSWIYQGVDRSVQTAIPQRRIDLNAPSVEQHASATLDLQGGGDLYAYEWIPGTGGSKDALSSGEPNGDGSQTRYGRFAILPSQRGQFAPYDPQEMSTYDPQRIGNYDPSTMRDSSLEVGDSVYLSGVPGLEAGYYALLPARYALLPGALLLESVPNTTDIQPGTATTLADGTPVVAGYRTFGSTGLGGARYTGFALRSSEQARQLAAYEDSFASKFYADRAARLEQPRPVLPSDAGTLSLLATTSLDMQGIVNVGAAPGGRAGRIEVAANRLELVATPANSSDSVQIAASVLNRWRPGELWLGGGRDGENVEVIAEQVRIAEGVSIAAEEIVLLANDTVEVASGASIATTSGAQGRSIDRDALAELDLKLANDDAGAAIVSVSDRSLFNVVRGAGDTEVGSVEVVAGSVLTTGGALLADAPGKLTLGSDIRARDAVWQLGASTVRFDEAAHDDGLNIGGALLARMQEAASLSIASSDAMEFSYAVGLGASSPLDELTLRAGTLRNISGADVVLGASRVSLAGAATAAAAPTAGIGTLSVNAGVIELDRGNLSVDGFARISLHASGDIIGRGQSQVRAGGDVDLAAARVTAESGGHTIIDAQRGAVRVSSTGAASDSIADVLGGALSINAEAIEHSGTLFLPSGLVSLNATSSLSIESTGVIDVAGRWVTAANRVMGSSGGTVRLVSGGDLTTAAGSRIDLSGALGANAGKLFARVQDVANLSGDTRGLAGSADSTGGSFDLYAGTLVNTSDLIAQLQTGGFTEKQALHVRNGDLSLAAAERITARTVEWTADRGHVQIDGTLRAPSAGQRSAIRLYGRDVSIGASAQLNADANAGVRFGGDIELGSSTGSLSVAAGSQISARGAEVNGTLRLRAASSGEDVAITRLAGTVRNVGDVVVEAVRSYDVPDTTTSFEYGAIQNDVAAYMASAGANIRNRLDATGALGLRVEAGAELRHDGAVLSLDALDLASWRFDANPVALTVRSTGSIAVNGTIGDGFGTAGLRTTLLDGDSATLRFAAGADLAAANPNAVQPGAAADFTLGSGVLVRSGTGDVRLSASRDVIFGANSSVYTGGVAGAPSENVASPAGAIFTFPDRGGNVAISAGRDVQGSAVTQSVNDWQRRQGTPAGALPARHTQWGIDFRNFRWNAGTLGGGDLSIAAGNDVTSIAATSADSAIESADDQLTRFGGGALSIDAGGDVNSAMLYVARGEGKIAADGQLGVSRFGDFGEQLGSLLMLGDARMSVMARQDINLETMFNPTILSPVGVPVLQNSSFFTYGDRSAVDVRSNGGSVVLDAGSQPQLFSYLGQATVDANGAALRILPSSLTMMSMTADVSVLDGAVTLFPSDTGQLDIFAQRDFLATAGATITMSDLSENEVPMPLRPGRGPDLTKLAQASAASARHIDDDRAALVTAGRDIRGHNLLLAKSAQMTAGRDIIDTSLRAQNLRASDVTSVHAGRDMSYAPTLLTGQMSVGGPGRFDVLTGRNLDLGFSGGLTTTGRLQNAALGTDQGADLNVMVGMGRDIDANAFVDDVIAGSSELRDSLLKFMVVRSGDSSLTYDQAVTMFKALDATAQRPLLLDSFYGELVAAGREANSAADLGFERGYRAIDALFPGSRAEEGQQNPFAGDLTLAFSRIYTLAGGDVSIAVPGGLVNVGLANPPASVQQRPASELGIVAQRSGNVHIFTDDDVLVNQSRVFTLLGGNIAIWSTNGDIDAGRGSKSSVSAPPPAVLVDPSGRVTLDFSGAVAGSGIRTISTEESIEPGDVDLIAPRGIVNAGDAGIGAGRNLNIAAEQVVGLDNIQVGGVSTGVPPETSGLGASLSAVSAVAASSSSASTSSVEDADENQEAQATLAQTAMSWLEVFVVGLGEENCKQDDVECLKRQPLP